MAPSTGSRFGSARAQSLALVVLFFASPMIAVVIRHASYPGDGWGAAVMSLMAETDTEEAPGYSEERFRRIAIGLSEREVRQLAGEPLDVYPVADDLVGWRFTRSPGDHSHRVRAVLFKTGHVTGVISEFYDD